MDISGEFLRPEFAFEREFGQFRNWWARDKRIVGNAFSLLIYLISHDRNYRVTQKTAQQDLGLGRDAFLVARRKLERAGFLTVTEHRYPAGSFSRNGQPIGGHRQMIFTLQDPDPPANPSQQDIAKPSTENPRRPLTILSAPVDNSHPGKPGVTESRAEQPIPPCTENPAQDFPPHIEDQSQENQKPSSSTSPNAHRGAATTDAALIDDEDFQHLDAGTATLFRELHHRLDLGRLLERLKDDARLNLRAIDFERAAADVIGHSARPVGDPVAYLATAIIREPGRWVRSELLDEATATRADQRGRPPTERECEARGHRWIGQWNEFCAACGAERDGWRDQRDSNEGANSSRGN
jgi:hypothetical protein